MPKNIVMKLSQLKSNPNNPRLIKDDKFKKLVTSLREFPEMMEKRPMVCVTDTDGKLYPLGGNMRLKALQELKYKEIPDNWVMLADEWSEEKRKEFTIKDNVGFGEWDWDTLANEWNVEELSEWGLDIPNFELDEVLEAEEDDFDVPEGGIETDIVLGDLFEIGNHRLLCGDSTDSDSVAKLMNGEKADMVFTDPPYDFTDNSKYTDILLNNTENAHIFVMHDDAGIVDYLRNSKLKFKQFFVADFNFASPRGNDPYLRHILISHEENGDAIKHQNFHDGLSSIIKMEYRGNLKDEKTIHKHQKSVEFISKFVKHYSNENDIILDLFLGSGSTMVAAHQLKRKCYGMELDPKYCQVIVDRMKKLDPTLVIKKNGVEI